MAYKAGLHKKIFSIFDGVQIGNNTDVDNNTIVPPRSFPADQTDYSQSSQQQRHDLSQHSSPQLQKPPQKHYKDSADRKTKTSLKKIGGANASFMKLYELIKNKILPSAAGAIPNRQKAALLLIPVLCIFLFAMLFKNLSSPHPRKNNTAQSKVAATIEPKIPTVNWHIPALVSSELRDPMQPGSKAPPNGGWSSTDGNFVLKGIVSSDEMTTAIIGDSIVHEGDMMGDIKVVKINKDNVELEKNGQKITLKIGQNKPFQENVK